jgi:RNA polymerase sigma-70 factor (ECF subfamily)
LLERVRTQDSAAWRRLVDLYRPLVFSWCRRSGLNRDDAHDVLQEVFAAVAANIAQFRRERPGDTFRGWLRVIARNQIRLFFRREGDRPRALGGTEAQIRIQELPDELGDASEPACDEAECGVLCRRALELIRAEFEERTWQVFWLTVVDGRPAAEVCDQLKMKPGTVRQAKYKVLQRLRAELGDVL